MSRWTSEVRRAAFARLPKAWQPVATYYYYRARDGLERELPIACRALGQGAVAVDVGACEGVYTHAFARTGAQVEAFEPQPACLEILRSYERSQRNVRVHGHALGAQAGWATLYVPHLRGQAVRGHASLNKRDGWEHRVEVRVLDDLALPRVDVLKVDVEGRELDVVRGAHETIQRCRPLLLVEIEQRHVAGPMEQTLAAICDLGYRGHFVHPDAGLRSLDEFSRETHQRIENADLVGRLYINNFLFTPIDGSRSSVIAV